MSQTNQPIQAANLFAGGGEMGALMRSQDWSQTLFGPLHTWPQNLQIVVRILLASRFPIQVLWGADYALLYNDAYRPILGKKHPDSLGKSAHEVRHEVWDFAQPRLEQVRSTGQALGADDQLLLLERDGYLEECYFTYSYTPIFDQSGQVSGILNEVTETTQRVLEDRRQRLRNNLATQTAKANTRETVCQLATQALVDGLEDIPFALFYLLEPDHRYARLVSTTGVSPDTAVSSDLVPPTIDFDQKTNLTDRQLGWWLARVLRTRESSWINQVETRWPNLPTSPWGLVPRSILVLPLYLPGQQEVLGFLVAGISPYRALDQNYQIFFDGVRNHLSLAIARAKTYEEERQRVEDLAQLNQAKEAAQAILREQAQLLDLALDAIIVRDLNNIITYWNHGAQETYGWKPEEAIGQNVHDLLQAQFPVPLAEIEAELLQTGRWQGEVVHRHKNGDRLVIMGRWALKRNQFGEPEAVLAVNHDITQRKQAEEQQQRLLKELETERSRFETVLRQMPAGVLIADAASQRLVLANQQSRLITGEAYELDVQIEDYETETAFQGLHPDGRPYAANEYPLMRSLQNGEVVTQEEVHLQYEDGHTTVIEVDSAPIINQQGEITAAVCIFQDISERSRLETDRKQAEINLRESEARFRTLADNIAQLAWMADATGYLFWYNKRWFDFTGTRFTEMEGWGWQSVHHPNHLDRVVQKFRHHLETGEIWEDTFPLRSHTGEYRWFLSRAIPIRDPNGKVLRWFGTNTDITEQREAEQEREALLVREQVAREQAEAANRIKDEFLAVLSHELRSPLNPILGWAKLLQTRQFDEVSVKRALKTIERNAQLQAQLIEDLLDVSRILRGKLALHPAPVNLATTLETALESVRLAAEAKSITLTATLQPDFSRSSAYIFGDEARLQQIFWNLLSNAIKFTPDGGKVRVSLSSVTGQGSLVRAEQMTNDQGQMTQPMTKDQEQMTNYAQITITDTGKGIHPDFLPYVFERFRQEDGKTTRKFGGLGLGLAIARYLTELHGGTIAAESEGDGLGATFIIKLPLYQKTITPSEQEITDITTSLPKLPLAGVRILAVDDEADMRDLLLAILEQTGAIVRLATSAQEALEIFNQWQPDILISDIGMPDMDGLMLIQQIRQRPLEQGGQIPAIALTAYASDVNQHQSFAAGFQRHIAKPIEPEDLISAIVQFLQTQ